jgi:hypothetical protein
MIPLLLCFFLFLVPISSAHQQQYEGCCGDVPESLIWAISFLVLVGMLVVVGALFLAPSPPAPDEVGGGPCGDIRGPPPTVTVRIDERDLEQIVKALSKA